MGRQFLSSLRSRVRHSTGHSRRAQPAAAGPQAAGQPAPTGAHLGKMAPPRQQLVVVGHTEEERQMVGHVAAMRVHQQVPAAAPEGGVAAANERGPGAAVGCGAECIAAGFPPPLSLSPSPMLLCRLALLPPPQAEVALLRRQCMWPAAGAFGPPSLNGEHGSQAAAGTHHLKLPTSNTLLRSSLLPLSPKRSSFQVNLPYSSLVWGPARKGRRAAACRSGRRDTEALAGGNGPLLAWATGSPT